MPRACQFHALRYDLDMSRIGEISAEHGIHFVDP
jgi:hypothetical protein